MNGSSRDTFPGVLSFTLGTRRQLPSKSPSRIMAGACSGMHLNLAAFDFGERQRRLRVPTRRMVCRHCGH
jgi:hypothetical protein